MTGYIALVPILLAQGAEKKPQGGGIVSFLPMILIFGAAWFLLMRPQQKKMREHRSLMAAIKQGDRVVAAGGIVGTIRRVDDDVVSLQVADNVVIKVDRATVTKRLEKT